MSVEKFLKIALFGDGSSSHIHRLATGMAERGHQVFIISGLRYGPFPQLPGVEFIGFDSNLSVFKKISAIRKILKELKPDLLHTHFVNHGGYVGVLTGFHPHLVSTWGDDVLIVPHESKLHRVCIMATLRAADRVLSFSEQLRDEVARLSLRRVHNEVSHWGVDSRRFYPQKDKAQGFRVKIGLKDGELMVYSPRSLHPFYNHHMLIEAWPLVLQKMPQARLVLKRSRADQEYEKKLRVQAEYFKVSDKIIWLEDLPYDDLPVSYSAADIVVSVTSSDGVSMTMVESMLCGTPLLVADIQAIRGWVLEGETGVVVRELNIPLLVEGLIRILSMSPERRLAMGRRAHDLVIERGATREQCMDRLEKIYFEASQGQKFSWVQSCKNLLST